jgi:hypothetical protein
MTTRPATPLPWTFDPTRDNSANAQQMQDEPIGGSIVGDDFCIARIWSDTDSPTENAAYLCHAANSYPRLVEALREARIALVMEGHHPGMSAILTDTIDPLLRSLGESE